jgi:hypothetical protein
MGHPSHTGTLFLTYLESLERSWWDNSNHTLKDY